MTSTATTGGVSGRGAVGTTGTAAPVRGTALSAGLEGKSL